MGKGPDISGNHAVAVCDYEIVIACKLELVLL